MCWKTRCSDRREVGSDSLWHRPNPHTPPGSATVADLPAAATASASSAGISGLTRGGHSAAFAAAVVLALAEASLALTVRACSWVVAWRTAVLILEGIATRMHAHAGKWWWWWFRPASNALVYIMKNTKTMFKEQQQSLASGTPVFLWTSSQNTRWSRNAFVILSPAIITKTVRLLSITASQKRQ